MQIQIQSPKQSLNKAYLKTKVERAQIDLFKASLTQFLHKAKQAIDRQESEEHLKNLIKDFLKDTYYKDRYEINTRGRADLVIHHGPTAQNTAAVLMEVKRPGNKAEMISQTDINRKAMHEAVLYYLRERIDGKNTELKYIVITNIYEWYIFNAADFESLFHKHTPLKKAYEDWSTGKLVSKNTDLMYEHIGRVLKESGESLPVTFVDVNTALALSENALLAAYKIFSPPHLLKESFANDSNTLDNKFYQELLHIIGLEEIKDGGKKLIRPKAKPDPGSLYENTLLMLKVEGRIGRLHNPRKYGHTQEEVAQNMALELCITWINRILFLKLLEAQLYRYHQKDTQYRFLKEQTINDFDELNKLFFQVLALKSGERSASIGKRYGHVPYLNSSLFEITEPEDEGIRINSLDDHVPMPVYGGTVLKNEMGKPLKNVEFPSVLPYLLRFLDAYDFGAEGKGEVQEENKTLITASVLGLIFEKINGYKDGSFYTPGFITMYMCRETLRRAVVQKFNDKYGWNCTGIEDLDNELYRRKIPLPEANELINSLRICDPAVGSGHFLVSALNELIAIKADLQILMDSAGKRLRYDSISIANDELVVVDSHGDLFEYTVNKGGSVSPEKHLLQETLFREKQHMIENCLFGVDINPNSVKICRLRLWIELLKNAYYTSESNYRELHTLPNIDINIKQGNSLLSRFALDEDLSEVFKKQKFSLQTYRLAVQSYKESNSKEAKGELLRFIKEIKDQFRTSISNRDPMRQRMSKLRGEIMLMENPSDLFGHMVVDAKLLEKKRAELEKLEAEKAAIEANRMYEGAFEWRFEFPEVLDENGNYRGFDVVIGNPPYGVNLTKEQKDYLDKNFKTSQNYDTYTYFFELSINILCQNALLSFITPNTYLVLEKGVSFRKFIYEHNSILILLEVFQVFEDVVVDPIITILQKKTPSNDHKLSVLLASRTTEKSIRAIDEIEPTVFYQEDLVEKDSLIFNYRATKQGKKLAQKLVITFKLLSDYAKVTAGVKPYEVGKGIPAQTKEIVASKPYNSFIKNDDSWYPVIRGTQVVRYELKWDGEFIKYGPWLAAPRSASSFSEPKIFIRRTDDKIFAAYDEKGTIGINSVHCLQSHNKNIQLYYILALLNSRLINWLFQFENFHMVGKPLAEVKIAFVERLPIPDYQNLLCKKIINNVTKILEAKKANPTADTCALEKEIDGLVYELYGLTEKEIAIVEGEMAKAEA